MHPIKADFIDKMHASFSMSLPARIIDGIIGIGHCGNPGVFKEPEALVHEVLQFLSAENVNAKLRHDNKSKSAQHATNNVKDKVITETEVVCVHFFFLFVSLFWVLPFLFYSSHS